MKTSNLAPCRSCSCKNPSSHFQLSNASANTPSTGVTGYIGGEVLYAITQAFPDLAITALVRNSNKGAKVAVHYPKVRLVYGDLSSTSLIASESQAADIVVHTANCDDETSAHAIIQGISQKPAGSKGYLIHTSGTGILCWQDYERKIYGEENEKVYDDWENVGEMLKIPNIAVHRNVDKIVLAAHEQLPEKIDTAIVCPPCIYGPGRGPDNQRSMQVYRMAENVLKRRKGFQVCDGKNRWTEVHVQDLSAVYVALVEAALSQGGGKATWNDEGYYFAENGEFVWGDVARAVAKAAKDKGFITSADVESISIEEADKLTEAGSYLCGMNSRCRAVRARKLLGWQPKQKKLFDTIPDIVDGEARLLGVMMGHAAKAAGEA